MEGCWARSPLEALSFPGPAAVVYATLLHVRLFDPAVFDMLAFQSTVSEFFVDYGKARMVEGQTPYDLFLCSLYLYRAFALDAGLENERNQFFKHSLLVVVRQHFQDFVSSFVPQFKTLAEAILDASVDPTAAADAIMAKLEECFKAYMLPSTVTALCEAELVRHIDAYLTSKLVRESARCTFGRAMEWNSCVTVLGDHSHRSRTEITFDLFREAVSVVMMSSVRCADPGSCGELIPHLKPAAVLSILAGQKPDDVNPMPNDVKAFAAHFKLDPQNIPKRDIELEYQGNFEEFLTAIGGDWKSAKVKQENFQNFRFLVDLFEAA
jgi:hypothetical protein